MPDISEHSPTNSDDENDHAEASLEEDQHIPPDDESDDEIEELSPEDFPTYYIERDGLLFPSSPCPYPLPINANELRRLNSMHTLFYRLLGAHYLGPVPEVLSPLPDGRRKVLDLCTGTGKWAMDVARLFPEAQFIGVDIVPIATTYPLGNVRFEMHNVSERLRWTDGSFDLIHARDISMAINNWPNLINECARLLRPGGLFISCEWVHSAAFHPDLNRDPNFHAPASVQFFDALQTLLHARQVRLVGPNMHHLLNHSERFTNVIRDQRIAPIGGWLSDASMFEIGNRQKALLQRFAGSVMPALTDSGMNPRQAGEVIANYLQELETVQGLVCFYYITYARRI